MTTGCGEGGQLEVVTTLDLAYPFRGRWLTQNSPADRVPSHGTTVFATAYAIDFVPVDEAGRSASISLGTLLRPEPPERFTGFGRAVLAPVDGTVVAAHDGELDHRAYRGLPSIGYALTQRGRVAGGWAQLAGNHVMVQVLHGPVVAVCHLQRGSIAVHLGQDVRVGRRSGGAATRVTAPSRTCTYRPSTGRMPATLAPCPSPSAAASRATGRS